MGFGRKVEDGSGLALNKQAVNQVRVPNVTFYKMMTWISLQRCKVFQVTGIGQVVKVNHWLIVLSKPVKNKISADKACAACHQNHYLPCDVFD